MPFQAAGVTTLSDLQIDVDKDWKAHGIYNLGDLTPKVDGAYSLGESDAKFDTVYAGLMSDSIYKRNLRTGVVDTSYLTDGAVTTPKITDGDVTSPKLESDIVYRRHLRSGVVDTSYLAADAVAPEKLASDSIYKHHLRTGVVDTSYLTDNAATTAKVDPSVDLEFVRSNDSTVAGGITPKVDGAYNLGSPGAKFNMAYATDFPGMADLIYKTTSEIADVAYNTPTDAVPAGLLGGWSAPFSADIAYQSELMPVKFADIFDHANLGADKAKDIVYHANFNLPSAEARDKVAESVYGIAKDAITTKGFSFQVTEKKDFAFRTETPDHAYWHRMYNTPAAFETVYQDYTTSMQKKGTTPSKSAPDTADPNPQPGACWSVSMLPDGTQVGGFAGPATSPHGVAWDGTYLWHADDTADYIYQLKRDGTQTGAGFAPPGPDPSGLAWDGEYLWNSDITANYVYHLKTDGTQVGGFPSFGDWPHGLSWDGAYLWIGDDNTNYVYQVKPDGTQVGGFDHPGVYPRGAIWDGTYVWVPGRDAAYIYQVKTDGTQVGGFATPSANSPVSGTWDGEYLWHPIAGIDYIYQFGNAGNFDVNYRIFAK